MSLQYIYTKKPYEVKGSKPQIPLERPFMMQIFIFESSSISYTFFDAELMLGGWGGGGKLLVVTRPPASQFLSKIQTKL
jgi:hypothetical protein